MYSEEVMEIVRVSQKFQIVLPKSICRHLNIRPGKKLVAMEKDGVIQLISIGKITNARGIAKGISSKGLRDESERFD